MGEMSGQCLMQIYLDYSATTPTRPEAIEAIQAVLAEQWGNPSSLHQWGERGAVVLETARAQVADLVGAQPQNMVFTASGTEANNLAVMGIAQKYDSPQHLIISSVEHAAITQPAMWLQKQGWQVTMLPVDKYGLVAPADLQAALQPNTALVSVIYGQSEVGTIQPIAELAAICQQAQVPFHTDAVQAAGRVSIDAPNQGINLLSMSAHKLYGGGGVGALYVSDQLQLLPLLRGGGQEGGLRSGTQATAQIAGFGVAAQLAQAELSEEIPRLQKLRDRLLNLLRHRTDLQLTGHPTQRLPHHLSFTTANNGREVVRVMNLAGIGISAGAACQSGKATPSPILLAMGRDEHTAANGIRLTLGHQTTEADIDWTAMVLGQVLDRLSDQKFR
jgi:cysteine desulfurase